MGRKGEGGGGGGDVDQAEEVDPELECERNSWNGGVILWWQREEERKMRVEEEEELQSLTPSSELSSCS